MNLLVYLAERAGQVVSVDELVAAVWKGVVVGDGSVYLVISKLRQVLDDEDTKHIETIPKRGYRLTAPVSWLEASAVPSPASSARQSTGRRARLAATLGAVVLLALVGWGIRELLPNAEHDGSIHAASAPDAGTGPGPDSLADVPADVSRVFFQVYTSESLDEGLALIDRVTTRYPGLYRAETHGAKAWLYAQSLTNTHHAASVDAASRASAEGLVREHAEAALEADPRSAIAHIALGTLDLYNWRWSSARESFRRALERTDERTPAFAHAVWLSSWLGEHDQAIALAEELIRANRGDPARTLRVLAFAHAYAGNLGEALENVRVSLSGATASEVTEQLLVSLEIATGERAAALAHVEALTQPIRAYFKALAGPGPDDEGLQTLRARAEAGERIGAGDWAIAYLAAGDMSPALAWLERAAEKARNHEADESFHNLMLLKMNVAGDSVLRQRAFAEVLEDIRGD